MKNSFKLIRIVFGFVLSCFIVAGITSCSSPNAGPDPIVYLDPVDANLGDNFIGTWENNDFNYHSEYEITASKITDNGMNVVYNIISQTTVTSADGCTLVFCQVAEGSGTPSTPAGNCYAVALKMDDQILKISCPIDYLSSYSSLDELITNYTSSYNVARNNNWFTDCTKMAN